jgi:hypothetical protein
LGAEFATSTSQRRQGLSNSLCPSEYSAPLIGIRPEPDTVLTELAARSEFQSGEVPPVLVGRSRFAVGHFLGFAVFPSPGPADHS